MNFQEKLKEIRELAGLDENVKSILKQMTGKELVSYEGIDALVAALMEFYNKELKKKATTNHTHSKEQIEEFPVFGTGANEMLEGVKLAETLGIPYGGNLNNSNTKTEGTAYYDSTTKKTYKCTATNTLNYADASKYEAISNNDLLLKFQNFNYNYSNNSPTNQTNDTWYNIETLTEIDKIKFIQVNFDKGRGSEDGNTILLKASLLNNEVTIGSVNYNINGVKNDYLKLKIEGNILKCRNRDQYGSGGYRLNSITYSS